MPTYEYECEKCGYHFEEFQTLSEEPITVCPRCGGKVHRLIGAGAGIIFKGSGFYATDYARKTPAACEKHKPCCGKDTPCDNSPRKKESN